MTPSSLQTALAAYDNNDPREDDERMVLAAARSVAEGETIWWCKTHEAAGRAVRCDKASKTDVSCCMVEKILADPT